MDQLRAGLAGLDAELLQTGWIGGELGPADISAACAIGFIRGVVPDLVDASGCRNLAGFSARAEALAVFRAAPAEDGVSAQVAIAD